MGKLVRGRGRVTARGTSVTASAYERVSVWARRPCRRRTCRFLRVRACLLLHSISATVCTPTVPQSTLATNGVLSTGPTSTRSRCSGMSGGWKWRYRLVTCSSFPRFGGSRLQWKRAGAWQSLMGLHRTPSCWRWYYMSALTEGSANMYTHGFRSDVYDVVRTVPRLCTMGGLYFWS